MKLSITLLAIAAASADAKVLSLTPETYDTATAGKTVFIKFFAPWCGHCKSMAPHWEKLAAEWEGNAVGLIAEVDCTVETSRPLCDDNGVKGFPTLKWGAPDALEDYAGGREYDDFAQFATENLKPVCSVAQIDHCDDDEKALIQSYLAEDDEVLKTKIKAAEDLLENTETELRAAVEKLQDTYEALMKTKEDAENEVKNAGLNLMKAVLKSKSSGSDPPYDDLPQFATDNLTPVCSVAQIDLCDDDKKALIQGYLAEDDEVLKTKIKAAEDLLGNIETEFSAAVEKLQDTYEALMKTKEDAGIEVKNAGLYLMKAVLKLKLKDVEPPPLLPPFWSTPQSESESEFDNGRESEYYSASSQK